MKNKLIAIFISFLFPFFCFSFQSSSEDFCNGISCNTPISIMWIDIKEDSHTNELKKSPAIDYTDIVYVTVSSYKNPLSKAAYEDLKNFLENKGFKLVKKDLDDYFPYNGVTVFIRL